jgi:hypothetical protein
MLAQRKLAEFAVGAIPPSSSGFTPFEEDGMEDWQWKIEVDSNSVNGLYNVEVSVKFHPTDGPEGITVQLGRMTLDPTLRGSSLDPPPQQNVSADTGSSSNSNSSNSSSNNASQAGGGGAGAGKTGASKTGASKTGASKTGTGASKTGTTTPSRSPNPTPQKTTPNRTPQAPQQPQQPQQPLRTQTPTRLGG